MGLTNRLEALSEAVESANDNSEGIIILDDGIEYKRMGPELWVVYLIGAKRWGPVVDGGLLEAAFQAGRKDALNGS